ncbi:hypothetical protein ALC62_02269 [Cyphomyrmex costatus]|uniref:C2H2-type domain-containing protein n=1 Tax=Cyphomyrmex costatus TaxID=456900 RepID=A0A151IN46_9HYME|nr:hypothetical protein ALC62_02269 [Cyphomyrmex costatus]
MMELESNSSFNFNQTEENMLKIREIDRKCGYCGFHLPQSYDLIEHSCFHPFDILTLKILTHFTQMKIL